MSFVIQGNKINRLGNREEKSLVFLEYCRFPPLLNPLPRRGEEVFLFPRFELRYSKLIGM